jgi:hypothetical protein
MITFEHSITRQKAFFVRREDSFLFLDEINDPQMWKFIDMDISTGAL